MSLCGRAAAIAVLPGRAETAAELLAFFETLRDQIGVGEAWVARMNEQTLAAVRDRIDEEELARAWERGRLLSLDQALVLALDALS